MGLKQVSVCRAVIQQTLLLLEKASAAANEVCSQAIGRGRSNRRMEAFMKVINSDLLAMSPEDAEKFLPMYHSIRHSIDVWHKGKNVKKKVDLVSSVACLVSALFIVLCAFQIAKKASSDEKALYHQRALDLALHLWTCAEKANGVPAEFEVNSFSFLSFTQAHLFCNAFHV